MSDTENSIDKNSSDNAEKKKEDRKNTIWGIVIVLGLLFFGVAYCASRPNPLNVRAEDYGKSWPFGHHKSGKLFCAAGVYGGIYQPIVMVKLDDDKIYGLNNRARREYHSGQKVPDGSQFIKQDSHGVNDPHMVAAFTKMINTAIKIDCEGLIGLAADKCFFYTDGQDTPCTPAYRTLKEAAENRKRLYGQ